MILEDENAWTKMIEMRHTERNRYEVCGMYYDFIWPPVIFYFLAFQKIAISKSKRTNDEPASHQKDAMLNRVEQTLPVFVTQKRHLVLHVCICI